MLYIMSKEIDVEKSEILYAPTFDEKTLAEEWEVSGGDWATKDGWVTGTYRENAGGLIYTNREFADDIMLDFKAKSIPPCNNDLNFSWKTTGWDYEKNDAAEGYIAGLNGWWENKAGIERYPECIPNCATPLFDMVPGQVYHLQAGSIGGHCFICVDGKLVIEMTDPNPETLPGNRVGLGTYCSQISFTDFKVRKISWKPRVLEYTPNF